MSERKSDKVKIPRCLVEDIRKIMNDLAYWIDLNEFVRVAVLEKLKKERQHSEKFTPVPILVFEPKDEYEKKGRRAR